MDNTLEKDGNGVSLGWLYVNLSSVGGSLVKSGAGILHSVTINKGFNTATLELDDAITNTTPIIALIGSTSSAGLTLTYDVAFNTGLYATIGTLPMDVTISYL